MSKLIAIGGGSGSGKSTLARALMAHYPDEIAILSYDWYYKDRTGESEEEKARANYDEPKAIDTSRFLLDARALKEGKAIEAPVYDFATHQREEATHHVDPKPYILVDGVLCYQVPSPRDIYDFYLFVDCPSDIRLARRILRDEEERGRTSSSIVLQYLATVRPMHERYVESTKKEADYLVRSDLRPTDDVSLIEDIHDLLSKLP